MVVQRAVTACLAALNSRDAIVAGVSGGPDSMALLHALHALWPAKQLIVAHVNHMLRPAAADEAALVEKTAAFYTLPFYSISCDVETTARQQKLSLEEAGRLVRYQFFAKVAHEVGATAVTVAHHADDQAETVLLHLLRGSGVAGLQGMAPHGLLPDAPEIQLLRPFLSVSRAEIEAYCQSHQLAFVTDATNDDPGFLRNRVRHELIPLLQTYNPQIKTALNQLAEIVGADYDWLNQQAAVAWHSILLEQTASVLHLARAGWQALPLSLRRMTLRRAVATLRPEQKSVGFETVEQARRLAEAPHSGQQASLPGGLTLVTGYNRLTITADPQNLPTDLPQLPEKTPLLLPIPGVCTLTNGWHITATRITVEQRPDLFENSDPWQAFVNVQETDLIVRSRQPGERFQPLGMNGRHTYVKSLMINNKLPAHLRAQWPIVSTARHPVWIVGHHLDERVRVSPATTKSVVHLRCVKNEFGDFTC